jgi:catalase
MFDAVAIIFSGEALLKTAAIEQDVEVIAIGTGTLDRFIATAKTRQWEREASVRTLA